MTAMNDKVDQLIVMIETDAWVPGNWDEMELLTLHLLDSSPTVCSFHLLDTSPTGHFAYETFRLRDSSPTSDV